MTATASTQDKLDWLLNMPNGATNTANYKTQDFSAVVEDVTDGKGANVVIDFVGQSHWKQNIKSLAVDGKMTMLALLSGLSIFSIHKLTQDSGVIPLAAQVSKLILLISGRFCTNDFASKDLLFAPAPWRTKLT